MSNDSIESNRMSNSKYDRSIARLFVRADARRGEGGGGGAQVYDNVVSGAGDARPVLGARAVHLHGHLGARRPPLPALLLRAAVRRVGARDPVGPLHDSVRLALHPAFALSHPYAAARHIRTRARVLSGPVRTGP